MTRFFFWLLAGLILTTPCAWGAEPAGAGPETGPPTVSDVIVRLDNVGPEDDKTLLEAMARSAIFIDPGDALAEKSLQDTIDALKLIALFSEIHVDTEETADGLALVFDLTVADRIKDIDIDGNFPVLEREVLNAMSVAVGDAYFPDKVMAQESRIADLFKRQGFYHPTVSIVPRRDDADRHYVLGITIDKGPYHDIRSLAFNGNDSFSDLRLKIRMDAWTRSLLPGSAGRFIKKDFEDDIRDLREFYRAKGFAESEIDYEANLDDAEETATIVVNIVEGPRYRVDIEGNEEFWGFTLKKDLTIFEEGNQGGRGLRKSVRGIEKRYAAGGYPDAKVEVQTDDEKKEGVRDLDLTIEEGRRVIVKTVAITGNTAFDDEKILKQMLTGPPGVLFDGAFDPNELEKDKNAILSLYYKEGYRSTKIETPLSWNDDKTRVSVEVRINEGVQTVVSETVVEGNTLITDGEALAAIHLTPGTPFREYMLESDGNALAALISEHGRPYVRVSGEFTLSDDDTSARVVYTVDEGLQVTMGQVYITGNFKTRERIIRRELTIHPGDPFSPKKLLETQRNIRDLDIFESVRFKAVGLKERADTVDLFVEIEERKPYVVSFGGGYDTRRELFFHARGENRNLLGLNLSTWLAGEVSQIGYRGEYGFTEPRLLGSRIAMSLGLFAEEREERNQDFGIRTYGASAGFTRRFFDKLSLSLGLRYENRDQVRRDDIKAGETAIYEDDEFRPRQIVVASPAIGFDTRDSFINPKKGVYATIGADVSTGVENSLDNFVKYRFDARWYVTPVKRLTFALRGQGGYIDPYGGVDKVPDDQLFFLGGTSDVRGFDENLLLQGADDGPLGGHKSLMGSVEARIALGAGFELALFYDIGRLSDTFGETGGTAGFRSTAGGGIRYITPVGPIGFLYGFKLDPREEEPSGRLHFSIGYTF